MWSPQSKAQDPGLAANKPSNLCSLSSHLSHVRIPSGLLSTAQPSAHTRLHGTEGPGPICLPPHTHDSLAYCPRPSASHAHHLHAALQTLHAPLQPTCWLPPQGLQACSSPPPHRCSHTMFSGRPRLTGL